MKTTKVTVATTNDFTLHPGEGMLLFTDRSPAGEFAMVLNRTGLGSAMLHTLPSAQRRTWLLYHILTQTAEGKALIDTVLEMDTRVRALGDEVDLSTVIPAGNA